MTKIKENDFVEINYIGKIKSTGQVFDLTDRETAKSLGLFQEGFKYGPRVICVGQGEIILGIDAALLNKEVPSKFKIEIKSQNAFGDYNPKLFKTINTDILLKQKINPFPGLQITLDNAIATVKSVSRSRTTLDFNHPLAGKELVYEIEIKSLITDPKTQLSNLFENAFHFASDEYTISINENKAEIKLKPEINLPKEIKDFFENKCKQIFKNLTVKLV